MIQCEVAIGVEINEGKDDQFTEWFVREFAFFFAPRVGETIWIGDHLSLVVEGVEHGFLSYDPPMVRVVSSMKLELFEKYREFIKAWGFSGC